MSVRLRFLAWVFFRFGNFTFGGGSATVATLQHEIIDRRQWLRPERFHLCYALSRLTPGTNVLAFCAAVGWMLHRWLGALICLLAASIPCAVMAIIVTALYARLSRTPHVELAMEGAMVAAVAIMLVTGITLLRPHWRGSTWQQVIVFIGGSFVANAFFSVAPFKILIASAVVGGLWRHKAAS